MFEMSYCDCAGFSDDPESLSQGFGKAERILRTLFVKGMSLWPRFHMSVSAALDGPKSSTVTKLHADEDPLFCVQNALNRYHQILQPVVIELTQPISIEMKAVQG